MPIAKSRSRRKVQARAVSGTSEETMTRRRRFQRGLLIELEHGYSVRYYEYSVIDGVQRRKRVQVFLGTLDDLTKPMAKRAMQQVLASVNNIEHRPTTTTTFGEFAAAWLEDSRTRNQRPSKRSTLANRKSVLDNHILPILRDIALSSVDNKAMRTLVASVVKKGLSAQSVGNVLAIAKSVKASACDSEGNQLYSTKWNSKFIDCPIINKAKQNRPTFTSAEVTAITAAAHGRLQMVCILLATSGLRAGELLGLQVEHFDGSAVQIKQAVWGGKTQEPKTANALRFVDLHPSVCDLLKLFIAGRTSGFIFRTGSGRPMSQSNLLNFGLHPLLVKLKVPQCGFHAFRRFRNTFLRQQHCPSGLQKYWLGHADRDLTDHYDRSCLDVQYRKDVAASMSIGFTLPEMLTAKRPKREKPVAIGRQELVTA